MHIKKPPYLLYTSFKLNNCVTVQQSTKKKEIQTTHKIQSRENEKSCLTSTCEDGSQILYHVFRTSEKRADYFNKLDEISSNHSFMSYFFTELASP